MKIEIEPKKLEKIFKFPCLLKSKHLGCIVLAIGYDDETIGAIKGTALNATQAAPIGYYSTNWFINDFEVFNDIVTLEN